MRTKLCLSLEDASTMMAAAKAVASAQNWAVTIAIVDEAGNLIQLQRMDGASSLSLEIARRKAFTAVNFRRSTKEFEEITKTRPGFLALDSAIGLQGGLPISVKDEVIGGIGVSGVQSHQDEEIARAGIEAFSAD